MSWEFCGGNPLIAFEFAIFCELVLEPAFAFDGFLGLTVILLKLTYLEHIATKLYVCAVWAKVTEQSTDIGGVLSDGLVSAVVKSKFE